MGQDATRAHAFFTKTYVTGGMRMLLRQGLQRLAGVSGQAVFEMKQAMARASQYVVLAVDSTKLGQRSAARALNLNQIHIVVTELDPAVIHLGARCTGFEDNGRAVIARFARTICGT